MEKTGENRNTTLEQLVKEGVAYRTEMKTLKRSVKEINRKLDELVQLIIESKEG